MSVKKNSAGTIIGATAGFLGAGLLGGILGGFLGGLFGGSKKKVGREAIEQGTQTMTVGQQGQDIAKQAAEAHDVTIKSVEKSADDVQTETQGNTTGEDSSQNTEAANTSTDTTAADTTEQTTEDIVAQDPSVIITDPNEILKRKERRGLV